MTDNNALNTVGQRFAHALAEARAQSITREQAASHMEKAHIVGAGATITTAYEQLRNAAEYTEEHLLLQRAIRRFYRRVFLMRDDRAVRTSGQELAVELTLAGYVPNDTLTVAAVEQISGLAVRYYDASIKLENTAGVERRDIQAWTLDVLAVEVESLLNDRANATAFAQFAYERLLESIDRKKVFGTDTPPADYEAALFVAVHRALLKSDNATIRRALLARYNQVPDFLELYMTTNRQIDTLFDSEVVEKLYRVVDRQGAPLRILWRMIIDNEDIDQLLLTKEKFMGAYETQIEREYASIDRRIDRGVLKSVIFLFITKVIIGVALEVPYDLVFEDGIKWLPLIINLFFPPFYMVLLRFTLTLPGSANTTALLDRIETMFYGTDKTLTLSRKTTSAGFGVGFNIAYVLFFILVFGGATWGLWLLGFAWLHLLIFFMFLSAASFLGFRLSRMIRELEVVESRQNGVTTLRDFLYMPFVVVGRWVSEKYARVNIVATVLDMVIELPLKTILRLIRQWGAFISTKKDEL